MAISPKTLQKVFLEEADKYELMVDNLLRKKVVGVGDAVVIDAPSGMKSTHFEVLKPRYIDAGWKEVTWHSFYDQRDNFNYTTITFIS